jgi:hypothetical protein
MDHETEITIKEVNHNKLWSPVSNKPSVERWNQEKKYRFYLKKKTKKHNSHDKTNIIKLNFDWNLVEKFIIK